jgi:site-specific DNA-methyltransferase (adenine-specific)
MKSPARPGLSSQHQKPGSTPQSDSSKSVETRQSVHFMSVTCEWATPQWLFDSLHREFGFTLDPCSTDENAKCARHFTQAEDGLRQSWADEVVFMNPPYGREIILWMRKAYVSALHERATVVCLVPARTDTRWWHSYAMKHEIRLFHGRLCFGAGTNPAPFPSALIVMRPAGFQLVGWDAKVPARNYVDVGSSERSIPTAPTLRDRSST